MSDSGLRVIQEQIGEAVRAPKCHRCGCLQKTVEVLANTEPGRKELAATLSEAKSVFVPQEYDCLGCSVCYPAIAANVFAESYPDAAVGLDLCPTEEPSERAGWPPLPGDYHVLRYQAPVAVCTLNSFELAADIRGRTPVGLSIVGTLHTENLGIERLIRNVVGNPNVRFLILCGQDTRQQIGHLPGQSLASLFANGFDERLRIIGARGKRPVLKNITPDEVAAFRQNVELVNLIGEQRTPVISDQITRYAARNPGRAACTAARNPVEVVFASEPEPLVLDPAGYFVVYPEPRRQTLMLEHYTNGGLLDCILEGTSASALYVEAIRRNLVGRLDHAAYLGRELARAERTLDSGEPYVQDKAAGQLAAETSASTCECSGECGPEARLR